MTGILNGNCFIYVSPHPDGKVLPRSCKCAGLQCLIYHYVQPSNKRTLSWEVNHSKNDCPNQSRCKVYKKEGHNPGDEACDKYSEPIPKVVPFMGA